MVYVNSSPRSQLLLVHPGAHVHSPGELHVPPLRQPPEQTAIRNIHTNDFTAYPIIAIKTV